MRAYWLWKFDIWMLHRFWPRATSFPGEKPWERGWASSKFHSATRSGNKASVLLMIPPLLLASWNYNDGMNFYYEISRGYYFLLCHPKFRRCVNQRHKHKRSMTFAQSWMELTPHQISLTTRPGVASKSTRVLAYPSLTSSLYRLKVSKNCC